MTIYDEKAKALDIALYGEQSVYTPPEMFQPRRDSIAAKLAELFPNQQEKSTELPVLPTARGTVIKVRASDKSANGKWFTLGPHGTWYDDTKPEGMTPERFITRFGIWAFEVVSEPRVVTAKEVLERVIQRPHAVSIVARVQNIAADFGVEVSQ